MTQPYYKVALSVVSLVLTPTLVSETLGLVFSDVTEVGLVLDVPLVTVGAETDERVDGESVPDDGVEETGERGVEGVGVREVVAEEVLAEHGSEDEAVLAEPVGLAAVAVFVGAMPDVV